MQLCLGNLCGRKPIFCGEPDCPEAQDSCKSVASTINSSINMDSAYNQYYLESGPRPHPYLHEPLLYITNIPAFVSDEMLAMAFVSCGPFRPKIQRDGSSDMLSGIIEFKFLEKGD